MFAVFSKCGELLARLSYDIQTMFALLVYTSKASSHSPPPHILRPHAPPTVSRVHGACVLHENEHVVYLDKSSAS